MQAKTISMRMSNDQRRNEKPFKMMIQLFCIFGCSVHILLLSVDYFKFKTTTLYAPYIPFEQSLPFISVCLKLDSETVKKLPRGRLDSQSIEVSTVIRDCFLRNFTSKYLESIECHTGYETTRTMRKRRYDCYSIAPKIFTRYMILEAAAFIKYRRVLYTFYLSQLFDRFDQLIPLIHFKKRPEEEFDFSRSVHLAHGVKNMSIEMNYKAFDIFLLPSPYDTHCIDESLCFDSGGKRYKWCTKDICNNTVAITYRHARQAKINGLLIQVTTLVSPSVRLSYVPLKTPNMFIFEIFTLLGLWFNFSIHLMLRMSGKLLSILVHRSSSSPSTDARLLHANSHPKLFRTSGVERMKVPSVAQTRSPAPLHSPRVIHEPKILKFILKSIVLMLFIRELYVISTDYFLYRTHMDIQVRHKAMVAYPSLSYCGDIYEYFNHKEPDLSYKTYDKLVSKFAFEFNYTLKQLFELTLPAESAIKECQVRDSSEDALKTTNDCSKYFNVSKFFFGDFMCYYMHPIMKFIPPNDFEQDISIIYSIILHEAISKSYHYRVIVSDGIPTESRLLVNKGAKEYQHLLLNLSFKLFKYKNLPAPYDSKCSTGDDRNDCQVKCMNLRSINLVHFSNLLTELIDFPILDYVDLKNETIATFVSQAEEKCSKICLDSCANSFTRTIEQVSHSNHTLQLTLLSPKYPDYYFNAIPVHTLYQYIYQLACSASFWIGFSLLTVMLIVTKLKLDRINKRSSNSIQLNKTVRLSDGCVTNDQKVMKRPRNSIPTTGRWTKNLRSRLKNSLLIISLTIGFCIHTLSIVSIYLQYPVSMDTRLVSDDDFTDLKATVCISIDQLNLANNFTLRNIWTQSPNETQIIIECGHRGIILPELSHLPRNLRRRILPYIESTDECNILFQVKKFLTLGLICYEIISSESSTDTEYQTQYQILDSRVFSYFILSKYVSKYNLTIALSQGSSVNTILMPTTPDRTASNLTHVYYYLHYAKFRLTSLPHPYNMGVYDSLKRIMCMRNCIGRRMRRINIFSPYDTAIDANYLPYEKEIDSIQNNSIEIKQQCQIICKYQMNFKKITDIYFDTFSEGPYSWHQAKRLYGTVSLWLTSSIHLVTETTFHPKLRLVDLVISVGSLFAVWFGHSVVQFIDLISTR